MIIWGGSGPAVTDEAERYDPVLDNWSPATLTGAPAERSGSGGVSTGNEMIIWGGGDVNGASSSQAWRYDVPADSWSPASLEGAPWNRATMSVGWTGDSMLVWGGDYPDPSATTGTGVRLTTGGRYCACTNATFYRDVDADGVGESATSAQFCSQPPGYAPTGGDCNDTDPAAWQTPSESLDLMGLDQTTLSWQPPASPGGSTPLYDVIRSADPADYVTSADCIASDSPDTTASDAEAPPPGGVFYYLVRAESGCVPGEGSLGTDSNGTPRTARYCP
jgi:hypothetical protein